MRLECQPCKENVPHNQRRERYNLPLDDPLTEIECYCLSQEPDFAVQCEWSVETVENREHSIIFYLKYHCELNFIERIWGYIKARGRQSCDYNFEALKTKIPEIIQTIPPTFVRKVYRNCFRMMHMYTAGLEGLLLDYVNRKYKSHKRIPDEIDVILQLMDKSWT